MRRHVAAAVAIAALWGFWAVPRAQAQYTYQRPLTSPFYRPPVSPYLNLANPGLNPAIGYYTITRPTLQIFGQLQQLQADVQNQRAGLGTATQAQSLTTGHGATFFNYSHYYTFPSAVRGAGGAGTAGGRAIGSGTTILGTGTGGFAAFSSGRR